MESGKKSPSDVHREAEQSMFKVIKESLGVELENNAQISVGSAYIQPDFYSEDDHIIGEIFAHIGKPKAGQDRKVAKDILKMLLLEKETGDAYKKMIVVCDEEQEKKLKGVSWIAECIRQFEIEVEMIDIDPDLRDKLKVQQEQQRKVNT